MEVDYFFDNSVLLLKPHKFHDDRGFFSEIYSSKELEKIGIDTKFVQENFSLSKSKNVFRGLHFQKTPHEQAKLIRVLYGSILDIVVDLRKDSNSFLSHKTFKLSKDNFTQIYIPKGFAHGFLTLSSKTEISYKTSDFYYPELERSISWEDKSLKIKLPVKKTDLIISDKDKSALTVDEVI